MKVKTYALPVQITPLGEGWYRAECPVLQGCFVDGQSLEEVISDIQEAIALHLESCRELGIPLPKPLDSPDTTIVTVIPVTVLQR